MASGYSSSVSSCSSDEGDVLICKCSERHTIKRVTTKPEENDTDQTDAAREPGEIVDEDPMDIREPVEIVNEEPMDQTDAAREYKTDAAPYDDDAYDADDEWDGLSRHYLFCHRPEMRGFYTRMQTFGCCSSTRTLTVLAIQAYAELNQWDLVLPFVQNVYGNVESCPARVIQLCLLLHARVKQFVQCHAMAKVWLQYNASTGIEGYTDVAKLYVRQILIPLGAYNLVAQFVEGCSELTFTDKQMLLSPVNKSEEEVFRFEKKQSTHCSREVSDERVSEHGGEVTAEKYSAGEKRFRTIRTLWCVLQKALARWKDWKVWRILVMLTLGTMALLHTQFGDSFCGLNHAIKVWEAIIITWNRICGT
ncbi:uncharacterized protein LOC121367279 [Gigantopelta aegis]|uniref:uncharacterized protein LOC121367279 n=1 Tax=Gigantopelta aegis TaxID=1735272 RepID=UPI001B88ACAD|nr:uncharacterized protein LOC121367279 [Gigantopelta aegis]